MEALTNMGRGGTALPFWCWAVLRTDPSLGELPRRQPRPVKVLQDCAGILRIPASLLDQSGQPKTIGASCHPSPLPRPSLPRTTPFVEGLPFNRTGQHPIAGSVIAAYRP
jgi:hypothetical protein